METIEVQRETAKLLAEQASARGLSIEAFLRRLLVATASDSLPSPQMTPSQRASAYLEWANGHHLSVTPLSDEAMSRESIYSREDEQV